jgi:predicted lipid carrier protein YhbT
MQNLMIRSNDEEGTTRRASVDDICRIVEKRSMQEQTCEHVGEIIVAIPVPDLNCGWVLCCVNK